MKVIVGLGNPGSKYKEAKHNIGLITLDEIVYRQNVLLNNSNFKADIAGSLIGTEKVLLVEPLTLMNEPGHSVGPLSTYFEVDEEDLIVIYDDLDLEIGKICLRQKGSTGGHNGIKSLIARLGTNVFPKIKIGIGRPSKNDTVIHHVLSTFFKETHEEMLLAVKKTADAALYACEGHMLVETMSQFNGKQQKGGLLFEYYRTNQPNRNY